MEITAFEADADSVNALPAVAHWSSWVDYWLIDSDHDGVTFRARLRVTRTPKKPLAMSAAIEATGRVLVRVIDVLGEEATVEVSG